MDYSIISMLGEKQVQSAVIQVSGWMIVSTYVGKAKPLSHDRSEEKIKLMVSSLQKIKENQFIYVFELLNLKEHGLDEAKEFKDLKEFHYYLKFNPQNFRFKQKDGQGIVSVMYVKEPKDKKIEKKSVRAEIKNGNRFIVEDQGSKQKRIREQKQKNNNQIIARQELDRNFQEKQAYSSDTLVVQNLSTFLEKGRSAKKILIKAALMDLQSEECEMKNDREIDRMAIDAILKQLPNLKQNLQYLTIQWHKMSTTKAIADIFKACKGFDKLKVINFDNLGNGFVQDSIKKFNENKIIGIEEVNIFFNIWDEDNYFEESWWHPEHAEKYRGKTPIKAQEWMHFASIHKNLSSIWIPGNIAKDIDLLFTKADWKKLALGYYDDQEMGVDYWKKVKDYFSTESKLVSLCISRIKDVDEEALSAMIKQSSKTLEYIMLNWCEKETKKGLQGLAQCKQLKYINFKHSPLQQNTELDFSFLRKMDRLQFLNIDNFKEAKEEVKQYIKSDQSKGLKYFGAPRNQWITVDILLLLSQRKLTKLNLYNVRGEGFDVKAATKILGNFKQLRVLNLGATQFDLIQIRDIVSKLKYLKKLNISDIKCEKTINSTFYDANWEKVKYPIQKDGKAKAYKSLNNNEKQEFAFLINNLQIAEILPLIPRITHLDMRNLGVDERPFINPKLVPQLRYAGCEFELYKKMQTLGRRGLTFV